MRPNAEATIVDAIYREARDETELHCAVSSISAHFNCPSLLFGDLDRDRPERSLLIGAGNMDAGQIRRYVALAHMDPAAPVAMRALPAGGDGLSLDPRGSPALADREISRQAARWHADVLAGGYVRVPRPSTDTATGAPSRLGD